jgi:Pyruvate/2-oxoacid:ferredoxin oxidoreductase gamma subunit
VSHLRFGPDPIRAPYLISQAGFIGCHQSFFLERYDMLRDLKPGGTFLLNASWAPGEVWGHLPRPVQAQLIEKKARLYVIDAYRIARDSGVGGRINTIMQVCFFAIAGILKKESAIDAIKKSIEQAYGKKGEDIVAMNLKAVDESLANLHEVPLGEQVTSTAELSAAVPGQAPDFVQKVLAPMIAGRGDDLGSPPGHADPDRVDKAAGRDGQAGRRQGSGDGSRVPVGPARDLGEPVRTVVDGIHAGHDGEEHLRGADIRGRLLAPDVLFAGLEGEAATNSIESKPGCGTPPAGKWWVPARCGCRPSVTRRI